MIATPSQLAQATQILDGFSADDPRVAGPMRRKLGAALLRKLAIGGPEQKDDVQRALSEHLSMRGGQTLKS
jgi:hypothetical protein